MQNTLGKRRLRILYVPSFDMQLVIEQFLLPFEWGQVNLEARLLALAA
jgi:hypothetical protein